MEKLEERVLKGGKGGVDERWGQRLKQVKVGEKGKKKGSKVSGFRFQGVYEGELRDEEVEVKEVEGKVRGGEEIDKDVQEYVGYWCGLSWEEIKGKKERVISGEEKIGEVIGEVGIVKGK